MDRFTSEARKALELAQDEALRLHHAHIGTEHLLLGLLRQASGRHAVALRRMGLDPSTARGAVDFLVRRGEAGASDEVGLSAGAKKAIELAVSEANQLRHDSIGPEHLLLGVVRGGEGLAASFLEGLGVTLEGARTAVTEAVRRWEPPGIGRLEVQRAGPSAGPTDPWRGLVRQVDISQIESLLADLDQVNEEIAYRRCATGPGYECGLIRFQPTEQPRNQITHVDKDVIAHVLRGRGQLTSGSTSREMAPGDVVRIPAGTPHDFAAVGEPLVLFYASVTVPEGLGA
jgi:ATP-dependent Clp protease ATP-binding subunit ClpC